MQQSADTEKHTPNCECELLPRVKSSVQQILSHLASNSTQTHHSKECTTQPLDVAISLSILASSPLTSYPRDNQGTVRRTAPAPSAAQPALTDASTQHCRCPYAAAVAGACAATQAYRDAHAGRRSAGAVLDLMARELTVAPTLALPVLLPAAQQAALWVFEQVVVYEGHIRQQCTWQQQIARQQQQQQKNNIGTSWV